ncbi:hypothetical protein M413DRAFT_194486 [Hebeloma cylindrosporum]|uniref:Uncharacterized protein n=1 Tax=Hebeloma cylindrosporum TaxID=76867 RepID=A0A0C3BSL4_HEBCY|nr:hypothetical protein M413DRAFT_194486 [Hebeloma cylindrosporum h7]
MCASCQIISSFSFFIFHFFQYPPTHLFIFSISIPTHLFTFPYPPTRLLFSSFLVCVFFDPLSRRCLFFVVLSFCRTIQSKAKSKQYIRFFYLSVVFVCFFVHPSMCPFRSLRSSVRASVLLPSLRFRFFGSFCFFFKVQYPSNLFMYLSLFLTVFRTDVSLLNQLFLLLLSIFLPGGIDFSFCSLLFDMSSWLVLRFFLLFFLSSCFPFLSLVFQNLVYIKKCSLCCYRKFWIPLMCIYLLSSFMHS